MTCLEAALRYAEKGFSVIPIDVKKVSLIKWEPHQTRRATPDEIKVWFKKWPNCNVGIVTGAISDLLVTDCDTVAAIVTVNDLIPDGMEVPSQHTPSGGRHFVFKHQEGFVNRARVAEGIDVRTSGGYFVTAPSVNGNGQGWNWLEGLSLLEVVPPSIPESLSKILALGLYKETTKSSQQMTTLSTNDNIFSEEGRRDQDLFHVANIMVRGGASEEEVLQILEILALKCNPPFPENEVIEKIKSAFKRAQKKERNLTQEIREWVLTTTGVFLTTEVAKGLHLTTREEEKHLTVVLGRLCNDEKLIERYGERRGTYRLIEQACEVIDWKNCDEKDINLSLPLAIEELVEIYPENIIMVAGEKDAGKTAFLLNCAIHNAAKYKVHYFSSEMSRKELQKRIKKFGFPDSKWELIEFRDRAYDFHDVIKPDDINIIDFLEIHDEFYKIGGQIKKIADKLKKGVALIGLQKNPGTNYGLGGMRGVERARLYVSLEASTVGKFGKAKIMVGKNRRFEEVNPVGMIMEYSLRGGALFTRQSSGWHYEEKEIKSYPKNFQD